MAMTASGRGGEQVALHEAGLDLDSTDGGGHQVDGRGHRDHERGGSDIHIQTQSQSQSQ